MSFNESTPPLTVPLVLNARFQLVPKTTGFVNKQLVVFLKRHGVSPSSIKKIYMSSKISKLSTL